MDFFAKVDFKLFEEQLKMQAQEKQCADLEQILKLRPPHTIDMEEFLLNLFSMLCVEKDRKSARQFIKDFYNMLKARVKVYKYQRHKYSLFISNDSKHMRFIEKIKI